MPLKRCVDLGRLINNFELDLQFNYLIQEHRINLSPHMHNAHADGQTICSNHYFEAIKETTSLRVQFAALFEKVDALIMPSTLGESPRSLGSTDNPICNGTWALIGFPVINLPNATLPLGMTLCMQLIGAPHHDLESL